MKNGKGIIEYINNNKILNCEFINNKREGKGIIKFKNNNDYIEIKFKNDKINEEGIYYYYNGDIYDGELDDNLNRNGNGILRYKNGLIYNGEWKNNEKNGKGIIYSNEDDYEIIIKNNQLFEEYKIKEIFKLNIKDYIFKGNFINNKKNGEGILYKRYNENFLFNDTIFIGEYKENKIEGEGIIHFINDNYFKGYWKNDNIDENKEYTLYTNKLKEIRKINLKYNWNKIISMEILNYNGNNIKNIPFTSNIK